MAVAEAIKACRPQVISAYPISPQTHIVENLAKMVADGILDSQFVRVESEFSASSVVLGASATGVRAYTASSSQGLLLMTEVLYNMAGMRLPAVITAANRTVSAPISIQPDHQDTMALRDTGLIQIHVESAQEAYAAHLQAFKLAEDPEIQLPVMVCMDGWILTHSFEPVELLDQGEIDSFLPPYHPVQCLNADRPLTYGAYADEDALMEFRYMVHDAMNRTRRKIQDVAADYGKRFGHYFGGLVEEYRTEGAEIILIAMGSMAGTIKEAIDRLQGEGRRVGLLRVRSYRPFPGDAIWSAVRECRAVAVLDRSLSPGLEGILAADVKAALYNRKGPMVLGFMAGLGGKDVTPETIREIVQKAELAIAQGGPERDCEFHGLNEKILQGVTP